MKTYSLVFFGLFQFLMVFNQSSELMPSGSVIHVKQNSTGIESVSAKIIFKSVDGGRTWQDITKGLPEDTGEEGFMIGGGFATDNGFYLRAGDGFFFDKQSSTVPNWSKEILSDNQVNMFPTRTGILSFNIVMGKF